MDDGYVVGKVDAQIVDGAKEGTIGVRVISEIMLPDDLPTHNGELRARVALHPAVTYMRGRPPILRDADGEVADRICALPSGDRKVRIESSFSVDPTTVSGDRIVPEVTVFDDEGTFWRQPSSPHEWDDPASSLVIPGVYGNLVPQGLREHVTYRGLVPGEPAHLELLVRAIDMVGNDLGELTEDGMLRGGDGDAAPLRVGMDFTPSQANGNVDVEVPSVRDLPLGVRYIGHLKIEQGGRVYESSVPTTKRDQRPRMVGFLVTPEQEEYIRHAGPKNAGSAHLRNLIRLEIEGRTNRILVFRGPLTRAECKPLTLLMPMDLKNGFKARAFALGTTQNELIRALIDADLQDPGEVPWKD